jgi:hypothetical protein
MIDLEQMGPSGSRLMQPIIPSWFKQRQAAAEPAGENTLKLTGPILPESYIAIRKADNDLWQALLLQSPNGPETAATGPIYDDPGDAWGAAFELFRVHVVV